MEPLRESTLSIIRDSDQAVPSVTQLDVSPMSPIMHATVTGGGLMHQANPSASLTSGLPPSISDQDLNRLDANLLMPTIQTANLQPKPSYLISSSAVPSNGILNTPTSVSTRAQSVFYSSTINGFISILKDQWGYFQSELLSNDHEESNDAKKERVENFLSVPSELEKVFIAMVEGCFSNSEQDHDVRLYGLF